MTRVTQSVKVHSGASGTAKELSSHMPAFVWVLRADFTLKLANKQGDEIDTKAYLEDALTLTIPRKIASALQYATLSLLVASSRCRAQTLIPTTWNTGSTR